MMRKILKRIIVFLVGIVSSSSISAQELDKVQVYPDNIYNDWVFAANDSNDRLLIYEEKKYYIRGVRNRNKADFKFSRKDNVFHLSFNDGKVFKRCGNDRRKNSTPSWSKGKWQLFQDGENMFLELQYFIAVKGGKYKLTSHELYELVHLEEDKMILRKLKNET